MKKTEIYMKYISNKYRKVTEMRQYCEYCNKIKHYFRKNRRKYDISEIYVNIFYTAYVPYFLNIFFNRMIEQNLLTYFIRRMK